MKTNKKLGDKRTFESDGKTADDRKERDKVKLE